jgi:hypothetical protein
MDNQNNQDKPLEGRDELGRFIKGSTTAGRPAGTPNKVTSVIKERFQDLTENNLDRIQSWIDKVGDKDPAKAMELYLKLAEYVTPKLARKENRIEVDKQINKVNISINKKHNDND